MDRRSQQTLIEKAKKLREALKEQGLEKEASKINEILQTLNNVSIKNQGRPKRTNFLHDKDFPTLCFYWALWTFSEFRNAEKENVFLMADWLTNNISNLGFSWRNGVQFPVISNNGATWPVNNKEGYVQETKKRYKSFRRKINKMQSFAEEEMHWAFVCISRILRALNAKTKEEFDFHWPEAEVFLGLDLRKPK